MTILHSSGFESGLTGLTLSGTTPPTQSADFAYAGTYSAKSYLPAVAGGVAGDYRSELTGFVLSSTGDQFFTYNTEYKFGAAIYIPSDYHTTPASQGDIVWQMHNYPFGSAAWTNPSWFLSIGNNTWQVGRKTGSSADTWLIPVTKGAWSRIVIEFKLVDGSGGYFKVYINDELVFDYTGDTALTQFNGTNGYKAYIKLGIYCWVRKNPANSAYPGTSTSAITVYYDAIKIGDASSTYADVDPAGGSAGSAGPSITSINSDNTVSASTAVNTAVTVGLAGAVSGTITDGTDSETFQAIGHLSGTQVDFTTGALTNIGSPATVTFDYAVPDYKSFSPRTWGDNYTAGSEVVNYNTAYGPLNAGQTRETTGGLNWIRTDEPSFSVTSGDVINFTFYFAAGTGSKGIFTLQVGGSNKVQYLGSVATPGSLSATVSTLASDTPTLTLGSSTIYPGMLFLNVQFTCNTTGTLNFGMGPGSTTNGNQLHLLGGEGWKNRALSTRSLDVTIPSLLPTANSAPTISSVTSLTSGNTATVVGTGLRAVVAAKISDGSTDATITDWLPNSDGTGATFTAPSGMAASGNSLVVTWAPYCTFDNVPTAWSENSGGALGIVSNAADYWVSADAADIVSAGVAWHRTTVNTVYAQVGDTVTTEFYYVTGSSPNAYLSVRNSANSNSFAFQGVQGALQFNSGVLGGGHTITEATVNGVKKSTIVFSNPGEGQLMSGIGPYSESDGATITALAIRQWTDRGIDTVSAAVTVASGLSKKIAFTGDNTLYCRSAAAGNASAYSSAADGDIYIIIGSGNPRPSPGGQFPTILAYATNATIVDGEYVLDDAELEYGSINALETGDQGYYMWASNASGSCRWSAPVQVIAE